MTMSEIPPTTPMKRVSRACLHCRHRKSRCDLDAGGQPPCTRCRKEGRECVLGGSNRGGSRIRKKNRTDSTSTSTTSALRHEVPSAATPRSTSDGGPHHHLNGSQTYQTPRADTAGTQEDNDETESVEDHGISTTMPSNPSDAWQLLTNVATRNSNDGSPDRKLDVAGQRMSIHSTSSDEKGSKGRGGGIASYRLVREEYLTAAMVSSLVARYAERYHQYLPLVPRKYFDPATLDFFAANDKHLLTAVLTIASKDSPEDCHVHACCSRYMHDLISGIAAGHDCDVEAVEAILLLAEWEPQGLRDQIEEVGRGEEDRAAWMHVGIALRTGYFLGLDRTSFRSEWDEESKADGRKRLAWAACYISDRLISVRIGKAFWSRGPGPMTGLSQQDFPSLQKINPGDEDHARVFQATLDLTQLYSNVHDVLYSGMRTSGQMMLMGDYVKYVDEFRASIAHWNRIWGTLVGSTQIKVTLSLSYDYLRLYTNAFAFQAAISQSISRQKQMDGDQLREHLKGVFKDVGSMPDARFIYESVAAARSYLATFNTSVDPEKQLRYMPLRFYLYAIYSAVFLFKARSYGVMDHTEEHLVSEMIHQTMNALRRASVSPQDAGARYAKLLELLWDKPSPVSVTSSPAHQRNSSQQTGSLIVEDNMMQYSPVNTFSWLDLEAVGDFASSDQINGGANLFGPMSAYQNQAQAQGQPGTVPLMGNAPQWQQPMAYNWQYDMNGDLLF